MITWTVWTVWTVWTAFVSEREYKSKTYKAFWQTNQKPKTLYRNLGMTPDIQKNRPDRPDCPDCP